MKKRSQKSTYVYLSDLLALFDDKISAVKEGTITSNMNKKCYKWGPGPHPVAFVMSISYIFYNSFNFPCLERKNLCFVQMQDLYVSMVELFFTMCVSLSTNARSLRPSFYVVPPDI